VSTAAPTMSGGTRFPSVGLPRTRWLTDVLTAPAGRRVTVDQLTGLRARLEEALASLVSRTTGTAAIRVDAYALRSAAPGLRSGPGAIPFRWSPLRARRSIGIVAVRDCVEGRARTPAEGVAATVADLVAAARRGDAPAGSLAGWLVRLSGSGRAVVRAEAVTWATRLFGALEWERAGGRAAVGRRDQWWDCPLVHGVGLRGRADVRILAPTAQRDTPDGDGCGNGRRGGDGAVALFTMVGGRPGPTSPVELGLAALVSVLARPGDGGPARVVGWWPDCGRALVVPVDLTMLERTAAAVEAAVRARLPADPGVGGGRQAFGSLARR